jgi:hypothetical protein
MNTIRNLLQDADPLRHQQERPADERDRLRQVVVAAASNVPAGPATYFPSRIAFLASLVLLIASASAILGWRIWPHGSATLQAAVRFEVRLAENSPGTGLQEAHVTGSGNVLYLHPEVIVSNSDILRSRVVAGSRPAQFSIAVVFTDLGSEKMRQASASHLGKPLAIIVDGEVVSAPTLRSPITDSALINGDYTQAEAERIASGMAIQ